MELQTGASFRMFDLGSNGTIFPDTVGNEITIKEFGMYAQGARRVNNWMKLSGSLRYDKNENFDGQINPRISSVFTFNKTHNIRMSYQTGFRIPTTQGQYINLDIISSRLLGGLPAYYDYYLPDPANNPYYTLGSVFAYRNRVFGGESLDEASASLERYGSFNTVQPEKVKTFEIGYKSLIDNKLLIDVSYYYSVYNNFITQIGVVVPDVDPTTGDPVLTSILNSSSDDTYSIYTNLDNVVTTQGAGIGLNYSLPRGYTIGGNYSWNKFIDGYTDNNLQDYNTPEHKVNLSFGNRKFIDNLGFNFTYRYQTEYRWESSFARGPVPAYSTIDGQFSYRLKSLKSVLKLGASNMTNKYYIQTLGAPNIGAIYYLSITFDELMN
jgi:outer membrane receptor protein involved in Fe transport